MGPLSERVDGLARPDAKSMGGEAKKIAYGDDRVVAEKKVRDLKS